jgi:hypothetical protein
MKSTKFWLYLDFEGINIALTFARLQNINKIKIILNFELKLMKMFCIQI